MVKSIFEMQDPEGKFENGFNGETNRTRLLGFITQLVYPKLAPNTNMLYEELKKTSEYPLLAREEEREGVELPIYCKFMGDHRKKCDFEPVITEVGVRYGFNVEPAVNMYKVSTVQYEALSFLSFYLYLS